MPEPPHLVEPGGETAERRSPAPTEPDTPAQPNRDANSICCVTNGIKYMDDGLEHIRMMQFKASEGRTCISDLAVKAKKKNLTDLVPTSWYSMPEPGLRPLTVTEMLADLDEQYKRCVITMWKQKKQWKKHQDELMKWYNPDSGKIECRWSQFDDFSSRIHAEMEKWNKNSQEMDVICSLVMKLLPLGKPITDTPSVEDRPSAPVAGRVSVFHRIRSFFSFQRRSSSEPKGEVVGKEDK